MQKLVIKKAAITDIPLIRDLAMQVWPQTYMPIVGAEQVEYMLEQFYAPDSLKKQIEQQGQWFIIVYSDGLPVAFASWADLGQGIFKLHKIYIIQGQQGKGIGRFIIDHIVKDIKLKHATALWLNVNRYNHSARTFYQKLGFKSFKEEDIDIGNGYFMNDYVLGLAV